MYETLKTAAGVCLLTIGTGAFAQSPAEAVQEPLRPALSRADLETWLDGLVPYALSQGDIAGMVVAVVRDGEVLLEKGYGYAGMAGRVPMHPGKTVVRAASISKAFTATAVMQLVEQGKLDLDADVNEYLDFEIPAAFGQPITLRHLLTHSAGFEETAYKRYDPPLPLRQHVLMIPERIYPPGKVPAYSNYGFNLAGYIVERVSGERIAEYVAGQILGPLGMERSTFEVAIPERLEPFAAEYYRQASSAEPYPPNLIVELSPVDSPSGGLATTAHDMTRFMLAHLQQGRYGDYRLLDPQTLALMHAPSFVPMRGAQPVALGLFRADYKGHRVIGHSGDGEGVHAEMKLLPDENVGIFTAVNSDGAMQGVLPAAFALRGALFEQFVDRYFPTTAETALPAASTALEHARHAAGEYVWSRRQKGDFQEALFLIARHLALDLNIRANADGTIETTPLMTLDHEGRAQTWREVGPYVWQEVDGNARLVMQVEDGRVQAVWSSATPSFWTNLRVPALRSAGLNVPLLGVSTGVLLLTMLLWPVAALIRKRYGQTSALTHRERRAHGLARLAAAIGLVYVLGWMFVMGADLASTVGSEPWIRALQLVGLFCVAGAGVAVWNAWLTWRGARGRWAVASSLVVALALVYLVWFSFAFHLISVRLN